MTQDPTEETPHPHEDPADPDRAPGAPSTATSPLGIPDSLTVRSEAAAAVGETLLASGMASYRVKVAMARTARALGLDSFTAIVTFTDITATATMDGRYRTRITRPDHVGVNVDHLHRTVRMVEELPARGTTAAEIYGWLGSIRARRPLHSGPVAVLAAAVACAAFAFLNQAGPLEMLAAGLAAGVGQATRRAVQRRRWNHLLVTVLAAVVTSACYLLLTQVPVALGLIGPGHLGGFLASVLFLVPGFPLITGLLDLVRGDYSAGLARLTYAAVIIAGAASAVWSVGLAAGIDPAPSASLVLPFAVEWPLRALATFAGVLGFAILFNSPWRIALVAASVSVLANSLRFLLTELGAPVQLATLGATALVGVLAYLLARRYRLPRTAISVPAVVIMIPGFAMYGGLALLNAGDLTGGVMLLQEALLTVLAAGMGLALAHLATSPAWRLVDHPH